MRCRLVASVLVVLALTGCAGQGPEPGPGTAPGTTLARDADSLSVLVFTRTTGFRHASIDDGVAAIRKLGAANGFTVEATDDPARIEAATLERFRVVVFLSTTGDPLDPAQQAALRQWVEGGGGWVGVHAAADAFYGWPWYGELVGAWFKRHPAVQQATVRVTDRDHPSTRSLPAIWSRADEWYDFRDNPRGGAQVLAVVDESSYQGGGMGDDHPVSWCHPQGRGRSWYTALGHTRQSWSVAPTASRRRPPLGSVGQVLHRGHVLLGDGGGGQLDPARDLGLDQLGEALALGDQLGEGDGRGGHGGVVEEGGTVQVALGDEVHRVLGPAGAGDEHLVLAVGVADRLDGAHGHVVVMGVDRLDVLLALEHGLHHLQALVGQEVGWLAGDDLDAAVAALDAVGEALGALLGHRDPGHALDLDHVALAVELVGDEVGRRLADAVVVAPDPGPEGGRGGELAVDVDNRDPGLHGLLRDRGERAALMREDDQHVRLLADERLDLGDLAGRVVG